MNFKNGTPDKLIDEQVYKTESQSLSAFFRKKGEILQELIGDSFSTLYPQEKIAARLNISVDQLRQKLYGKKPLTRDWLIAICAAYGLDDCDTSDALSISNMPTLDDVSNRETFIVRFLRDHKNIPASVNEFNVALESAGLPGLDISYRKRKTKADGNALVRLPYKELRPRAVRTYGYEGDPYNSLATEYLPNMRCVSASLLEGPDKRKYLLEAFSDGKYKISTEDEPLPDVLDVIEPSHIFYPFFTELSIMVGKQKQKLDDVLNDTKNYRYRFSANVKNDRIHIFYEEFNYSMPERNEYYLMEYVDGHFELSIAYKSMFMQEYLSEEEYAIHYNTTERIPRLTYTSIEEIDEKFQDSKSTFYPSLANARKRTFTRLQKVVSDKLQEIKDRKIFIQNFNYIWDNPAEVLQYYKIEDAFECKYDDEYGEIYSTKESAFFSDETDSPIEITFKDVQTGFELGLASIQEICRIKRKYGTIESILS